MERPCTLQTVSYHMQNAKAVSGQWQINLKTRPFCVGMLKETRVLYFGLAQNTECHTIIQCEDEGQKDDVFSETTSAE